MTYFTEYISPIGKIIIDGSEDHITGIWLNEQIYSKYKAKDAAASDSAKALVMAKDWLERYFAAERPSPSELPLRYGGSEFRQCVMRSMLSIPYGETVTYGEIAKETAAILGKERMSAQAVGGAVGHNPISIVIPCHRVIGAKGNLTGYGGGFDKKIWLLRHEGVDMTGMFLPKKSRFLKNG